MYAVVVREAGDVISIEGSAGQLEAHVVPRLRGAPGIVSAFLMTDGSGGTLNVIVFESEQSAVAALDPIRSAPRPPFMHIQAADVYRVLASL